MYNQLLRILTMLPDYKKAFLKIENALINKATKDGEKEILK